MKKIRPARRPTDAALLNTFRALLPPGITAPSFSREQYQVIRQILSGGDALAIMPTGSGKSACYQIPAMYLPGITLVITPLLALMRDQISKLQHAGVPVAALSSAFIADRGGLTERPSPGEEADDEGAEQFSFRKRRHRLFADIYHKIPVIDETPYKLLYITPERLRNGEFIRFAQRADISMIAVDEAHCVSLWGYDFRPRYLEIFRLIRRMGRRPIIAAFTATANDVVQKDITAFLDLHDPAVVDATAAERSELTFSVQKFQSSRKKLPALLQLLRDRRNQSGFVYCATTKIVRQVCRYLRDNGIPATWYYAGLNEKEPGESKELNFEDFSLGRSPVIVSTTALGMGIDKRDVRFVIHYNLPLCPENYYQEAGRAGRDKKGSECILFYTKGDWNICQTLIDHTLKSSELSPAELAHCRALAEARLTWMQGYAEHGEKKSSPALQREILDYFRNQETPAEAARRREETLTRLKEIDVLYVNCCKVAQDLRRKEPLDPSKKRELVVGRAYGKKPAPSVTYQLTGGTLDYFDLMVADAVYTLMSHRVSTIRAKGVMELLAGNSTLQLHPERKREVEERIWKMTRTRIVIDRTLSAGYGFTYGDPGKQILSGPFLPLWEKGGGFGYDPKVLPPLYEYAEILNGQFLSLPTRHLQVPGLPAHSQNLSMTHYLLCRISTMSAPFARSKGQVKAIHAMTSRTIRFDTMLQALRIELTGKTSHQKRDRQTLWNKMLTILRHLQNTGVIAGFEADPSLGRAMIHLSPPKS